jgi:hypothetical protein
MTTMAHENREAMKLEKPQEEEEEENYRTLLMFITAYFLLEDILVIEEF